MLLETPMDFRVADTFTNRLARLTDNEQKVVKTTAFDLQINPANPGMNFHKLDRTKDPHFWSVRASRDVRLIVHKTDKSLLLCYVDHHDTTYRWAERRKLERHPKTGAAQLVEVRERSEEITVPKYVEEAAAAGPTICFSLAIWASAYFSSPSRGSLWAWIFADAPTLYISTRAVAVMACDDEVIPLQARIESIADNADLEEVYDTEQHLLYVACTRARDQLLVTGIEPASEFLDDFNG